ncbi:MAG: SAF domain-containing protein [bacterium]|nr:SAF domain-containing protein [bacterium]
MNNFVIGLKRFFTNKNVVTIIVVLLILVLLYWGYSSSIKKQTNPVSVPVAAQNIGQLTQITSDLITYKKLPSAMLNENVIRNFNGVFGKYTNVNVTIPKDSVFYSEWLVKKEETPGNWIEELNHEEGELGYYMNANITSTLGNNVLPGTYIDIYMKAKDESGTVMFGKLLKNVKVLVVHDSNGNNIFNDGNNIGTPSKIGFAVNPDMYILLHKAEYLDLNLIIAPRGSEIPTEDYIIVTSSTLRDYIDAKTITVEEDIIPEDVQPETKDENNKEQNNTKNASSNNEAKANPTNNLVG